MIYFVVLVAVDTPNAVCRLDSKTILNCESRIIPWSKNDINLFDFLRRFGADESLRLHGLFQFVSHVCASLELLPIDDS